eukprot:TRINITY_DN455_c0_g2_i1.p3 TRINITY_DN455_c0_g2~~TRINITY_DN455_c0_g2_i1.p3  ORF type:complete len:149 (-),score=55.70 TRINITY_DN455_c0_g2_i1:949-1395(-)
MASNDNIDAQISNSELDSIEEMERQERISARVDPVQYGKRLRVQQELLDQSRFHTSGKVVSKLNDATDKVVDTYHQIGGETYQQLDKIFDQAANVVENAIAKVGLGKPGSAALEEHERSRREKLQVDRTVAAKKHVVERELLGSVSRV